MTTPQDPKKIREDVTSVRFGASRPELLREMHRKYRDLVENLTVGVYRNTPGPKGHFLEANSAMLTIFDAPSKKEFLTHNVSDLYQNPAGRKAFVAEIMEKGEVRNKEIDLVTLRGRKFVASITAVMKKDPRGNVYFDGILEDITERKRMEKELLESHETLENEVQKRTKELEDTKRAILNVMADLREVNVRSEAILSSIADGVIVVDKGGSIIIMNKAAEKLLGWTIHESIGKKWFKILNREDEKGNRISPEKGAIQSALTLTTTTTTTTGVISSYYYVRKDGTKFPVTRSVSPIMIGEKIGGVVNVFRDVSREKEIDKMKTEFVSLASHQLRTPLTSIKWNLEMMLDKSAGELNERQNQYVADAYQSNETMIKLVNSLLNIGRMESGRLTIAPKVTDLGSLFRATAEKYKQQMDQANLTLKDNIPHNPARLSVDPQLISNVYANLLNNSIKYTPSGGSIDISIAKDGGFLVSTVKDTGRGIPAREQKHIFERFFRGSNVSSAGVGSTGLGLYLAKQIVEASGGTMWFESTERKGSAFHFSLPLAGSPVQKGDVTLS